MKKINSNLNYTDHIYYICRTILIIGLPLTIVSALMLSLPHSSATFSGASSDNLILSLPTSCTLSSVVNTAHNATLISGTYTDNIGKTTITTLCNDGNGYAIYANGFSNNTIGDNTLISNINNGHNITTGLATSGDISNWAMKLNNVVNDSSPTPPTIETAYNNTYGPIPSAWTRVAGKSSGTTDMVTGSSFTTTYAVYTAPTQHAGTYTGQVSYALIHGSDNNPTPIYIMQDVASWKDSLIEDESVQAVDIRDSKVYWVTKLKDGNVWMTQNLDFDIKANTILDSNTTDLNVAYNSITGQYPEYNDGYTESDSIIYWGPASSTINFSSNNGIVAVAGWGNSGTAPYSAGKTDDANTGHTSLGNYYNWTAAIASNNSTNTTGSVVNSVCPSGWHLPTASPISEYKELADSYNISASNAINLTESPIYLPLAGAVYDNSLKDLSTYGNYWASPSNGNPYRLLFQKNRLEPQRLASSERGIGMPIRCVAR